MNPYQNHSDTELVALLNAGNQKAFEVIYTRYVGELFRYARKSIAVKEDIQEILQEVFTSVWARHGTLEIDSLRHYLFNAVRYKIFRHFYHNGVRKRYIEHYKIFSALYDSAQPEEQGPEAVRQMLVKSLDGLPERCQMAIKLRVFENLSNREIALRMNITKRTVELYISSAMSHLRSSFRKVYNASLS